MKKFLIKSISILLMALITLCVYPITTFAANYETSYNNYNTPEHNDWAYWSGNSVRKSSATTKDEIRWMQASINYLIKNKGLEAQLLDCDGSFGPASQKATKVLQKALGLTQDGSFGPNTIAKTKLVLSGEISLKGVKQNSGSTYSTTKSTEKVSTSQIQKVLDKYGYKTGKYWTYPSDGSANRGYKASNRYGSQYSYNYYNSWECAGFAGFVMGEVTDKKDIMSGSAKGWKKISGERNISSLQVGDIIRAGGHSAVVLSVDSKGKCKFAEAWGNAGCKINIGNFNGSYNTLSAIKDVYSVSHIWRYTG